MQKIVLQITGMHCTSCSMNIDGELEDTEGVKASETSYAKQETVVTYDPEKISPNEMIAVIKKLDYDAQVKEE